MSFFNKQTNASKNTWKEVLYKNFQVFFNDFVCDTQFLEAVSEWSYYGRGVPVYNRTKMGHITFLNYFATAISDIHLESGKIKKNCIKTHFV